MLVFATLLVFATVHADDSSCGTAAKAFHSMPRLDGALKSVSANIADYNVFDCSPETGTCDLTDVSTSHLLPNGKTQDSHSVEAYLQSIGLYVVIAMTVVTASIIATVVCVCSRCPYCICSKTPCCGGRKPSRRAHTSDGCCSRFCGCGLGMVANESGRLSYPGCGRWSARVCTLLFVTTVGLCVLFGEIYGIEAFPTALKQVRIAVATVAHYYYVQYRLHCCDVRAPLGSSHATTTHRRHLVGDTFH
jgi:hypothetical protein